jgi:hypothetical protein
MAIGKFELDITGETTAYLRLPVHPGQLRAARSVPPVQVMGAYKGPYVVFDFDQSGTLVGIEIVGDDAEEDDGADHDPCWFRDLHTAYVGVVWRGVD